MHEGCSFCAKVEAIHQANLPVEQRNAAIDDLFDLAERAAHARRTKHRRRWRSARP